jgi:hypothetical protein
MIAMLLNNIILLRIVQEIVVVLHYVAVRALRWRKCAARLGAPLACEPRYS